MKSSASTGRASGVVGNEDATGVPGLRTWSRVYAFVLLWFVVCVGLLMVLTEVFQ